MAKPGSSREINLISVSSAKDGLWPAFCNGDRNALGTIYRLYVDDLYHYGMHFCQDSDRVKDCLQDLFRDLWVEHAHLSADIENIKYYLITSFRRRMLRSLQKDRRNPTDTLTASFDFDIIPSREDTIITNEMKKERVTKLRAAVAMLSRRQGEVVYLRFYQGLSYTDIANLMSMKVESVYNLISKAIGELKNRLQQQ